IAAGEAAVRACLAKGLSDRARDALSRLRQLGPNHPGLAELSGAVGGTEEIRLDGGDVEEVSEGPEPIDGAELSLDEEGGFPTLPPLAAPGAGGDDDLALAMAGDEGDAVVDDEPAAAPPPELELELDAEPLADDDDLAAAAAQAGADDETVVDEEGDEPRLAPAPAPPARPAARPPVIVPAVPDLPEEVASGAEEEEEVDLGDELEEADFFVQQGLLDEAREALQNLLAFYPGHRQVQARLAEVERRAAPEAPAPAQAARSAGARPAAGDLGTVRPSPSLVAPAAAQGESFDIAAELAEELDGAGPAPAADDEFQYSVEDVFNQFKKGVAETVNAEDSDTHYDLGIAYKEMGLLDDAVHEFETALKGTNRKKEVDALSMIGLCRMAQGRPAEAVEALRRALRSDYVSKDSARALHFELGGAYEAMGQPQVALWFFQKVAKVDPAYRQASSKVAALGGGAGTPPADEARHAARPAPAAPPASRPAAPGAPAAKKNIGYL
ncbi:MAG TPA: tetratricopeptide repeat protein, partial [Anaeromyxobacteraceae bacterium]|nr:tetratricopeptide repeat protein [Anaeromyxobacteraceae bacterium]